MAIRIGRYEIEGELGHGGFGHVYLAYDPEVDWKVAIKVLSRPEGLKYFELETVISGKLQHKNIVTIHDRGIDPSGKPYLVMELLDGETIKAAISKGKLTLLQQVELMTQVAEGLEYAHSKGVVHRDIKPENIMVLPDFSAKIMDFGIALPPNVQAEVTEGRWAGTPRYQAPEQLAPHYGKANEQTDIFSYGLVYYELLTGFHPFKDILGPGYEKAVWNFHPEPVGKGIPNCPGPLELLVDNAIAIHPQHRYRKFSQIVLDNQEILESLKFEQALILVAEARQLQAAGQLAQARAKAEQGRRLDPRNREALHLYRAIEEQLDKSESHVRAAALLGEAERRLSERRFHEAVELLEAAARLDADNEAVALRLANARVRLATAMRANELFEASRSSERKGRLKEALVHAREALSMDPDHTEAKRQIMRITDNLAEQHRSAQGKAIPDAVTGPVEEQSEEAQAMIRQSERFRLAVERTGEAIDAGYLERAAHMIEHLRANFANEPGSAEALAELESRWRAKQPKPQQPSREQDLVPTDTIHASAVAVTTRKSYWKHLGIGAAAVVMAVSAMLVPRILHRDAAPPARKAVLVPVTIQPDPRLAEVRVDGRSCGGPDCRFNLAPGSYQLTAQMPGYQPVVQTLVVRDGQPPPTIHVVLQPAVSAPKQEPATTAKRGYLVVEAGIPDVLVSVDGVPTARTGPNGAVRLPVQASLHVVRAQKTGYRTPPDQRTEVKEGNASKITFSLAMEDASLALLGAPPGVEVRLGGVSLGRTDGSPEFIFPSSIAAGKQVLLMSWQGEVRPIAETFEPGQKLSVEWRTVAPPPKPSEAPAKTEIADNPEPKAWEAVRESNEPLKLQAFIDRYPASLHRNEALAKLDELFWKRTNQDSIASLQTYSRSFPAGRYVHDASERIDDLIWNGVDKTSADALKRFMAENPGSAHTDPAKSLLAKLTAPPQPRPQPQPKPEDVDRAGILATLSRLEKGYQSLDAAMVKSAWPSAPTLTARSLAEMQRYDFMLRPQEPAVKGDRATVRCARSIQAWPKHGHAPAPIKDTVVVNLRKTENWFIESMEEVH